MVRSMAHFWKMGDNHSISVIWVTYQQPELKIRTVDNTIFFPSISDYVLNCFFHSKNKTRALILPLQHLYPKFIASHCNPQIFLFFLHIWERLLIQIHWFPILSLRPPICNTFLLKLFRVTYVWTLLIPFYGAVPSSSVALPSGIPLMHFGM